ncbi:MAG: AMP-binding protein, partial [Pseudomonadota bacterium]
MPDHTHRFDRDLGRNPANHVILSPVTFLRQAAALYPDRDAIIHGRRRYSYRAFYERSCRLGHALQARGIGVGDCVAIMAPNIPEMLEAHNGVPMIGAVLNSLNIRLDPKTIAFILEHGQAKLVLCDREFAPTIEKALQLMDQTCPRPA